MASLSGNKIKDTYNLLLKLESAEVSSSEQVVEDGAGNNTALKLSTDTVETTGELKISGTPSTSTSNTTALMLSTSGVVVTRDLSTNPIGTASITPNLPIVATGSTVGLADPVALSQITTPANVDKYLVWDESASEYKYIESGDMIANANITANSPLTATGATIGVDDPINLSQVSTPSTDDKYLIWDESASEYKYIDQNNLKNSVVSGVNMFIAKKASSSGLSTTSTASIGVWAEIANDSGATGATSVASSSVLFGTETNSSGNPIFDLAQTSDPNDSVLINEKAGWFKITANLAFTTASNLTAYLEIYESVGATVLMNVDVECPSGRTTDVTMYTVWYSDGASGYKIMVRGQGSGVGVIGGAALNKLTVEYLGANTAL